MTSVFDGLAGPVRAIFGATVTVTPQGGSGRQITAIFREDYLIVTEEDGIETATRAPVLTLDRRELADLLPGGTCAPGNGKTYRLIARLGEPGPAPDGNVPVRLERIG